MKSFLKISLSVVLTTSFVASTYNANAGNPERAGQAGAVEHENAPLRTGLTRARESCKP